jgi:hypothetical protein
VTYKLLWIPTRLARPGLRRRKHRPSTSPNKRHGGSFSLWGFHPKAPALLRKARPANGLWAKPGNSQGILASLRCSCSLRTAGARYGGLRPTSLPSSCSRLSPKTASPWRNVVFNAGAGLRSLSFAAQYPILLLG